MSYSHACWYCVPGGWFLVSGSDQLPADQRVHSGHHPSLPGKCGWTGRHSLWSDCLFWLAQVSMIFSYTILDVCIFLTLVSTNWLLWILHMHLAVSLFRMRIALTDYSTLDEVLRAVEEVSYEGGNSRTGLALEFLVESVFSPSIIRDNAPKVWHPSQSLQNTFFMPNPAAREKDTLLAQMLHYKCFIITKDKFTHNKTHVRSTTEILKWLLYGIAFLIALKQQSVCPHWPQSAARYDTITANQKIFVV